LLLPELPNISPLLFPEEGPRGCHDPSFIREPNFEEFMQWQEAAEGRIVMVTIAPEREGSMDFIKKVTRTGVKIAIGHAGAAPTLFHYQTGDDKLQTVHALRKETVIF